MKKLISFFLIVFSLLESSCGWARQSYPPFEENLGYSHFVTSHKSLVKAGGQVKDYSNEDMNFDKVIHELTSSPQLKALAISMGTAGLTQGLLDKVGGTLTKWGLPDQVSRSVIQAGVSTGARALAQDLSPREALTQMVINVGATIAGGFAAKGIGDLHFEGDIVW
jgi:hypothetical protein